jgi:hypothetical protein
MSKLFPNYQINLDEGTVFSIKRKKYVSANSNDGYGHHTCTIKDAYNNEYYSIHQVIYAEGMKLPKHLWPHQSNGKIYEIDHIIPTRNGGTDSFNNLRLVTHKDNMNNPLTTEFISSITLGRTFSQESKDLKSKMYSKEGNPFWNKHHSDESKRKMSESRKGKPSPRKGVHLSDDTKKKLSENHKGLPSGAAKLVDQIDPITGEVLKTWKSAAEAGRNGFNAKKISACAKGYPKYKTHKGFVWKQVAN